MLISLHIFLIIIAFVQRSHEEGNRPQGSNISKPFWKGKKKKLSQILLSVKTNLTSFEKLFRDHTLPRVETVSFCCIKGSTPVTHLSLLPAKRLFLIKGECHLTPSNLQTETDCSIEAQRIREKTSLLQILRQNGKKCKEERKDFFIFK